MVQKGAGGRPSAGHEGHYGSGGEPHQRRARVVPEVPPPHRALHRLLHLAEGEAQRRPAQQLGQRVRGEGVAVGRAAAGVLPAPVRREAARPEYGQPQGAGGSEGDSALLAGHGGGRLPGGRHHLHLQKGRSARRSPDAGLQGDATLQSRPPHPRIPERIQARRAGSL